MEDVKKYKKKKTGFSVQSIKLGSTYYAPLIQGLVTLFVIYVIINICSTLIDPRAYSYTPVCVRVRKSHFLIFT